MRILFYLYLCCIHKNILSSQLTNKAFSLCCVANPCLHSLIIYYIFVVFFSALCLFTGIICSLSLFTKSTSKFILIYIFLFVDTMHMFYKLNSCWTLPLAYHLSSSTIRAPLLIKNIQKIIWLEPGLTYLTLPIWLLSLFTILLSLL